MLEYLDCPTRFSINGIEYTKDMVDKARFSKSYFYGRVVYHVSFKESQDYLEKDNDNLMCHVTGFCFNVEDLNVIED